jgi:hypothetical protein
MENSIDRRYRELLFNHYFEKPVLKGSPGNPKWVSPCPFCSQFRSKPSKRRAPCSVLQWIAPQKTWKFYCQNKGTGACSSSEYFRNLIANLNPALGRQYVMDRYSAGTTGKGTNCPNPDILKGKGRAPDFKSRRQPKPKVQDAKEEQNPTDP